jgi:hypothetical protein
VTQSSLVLTTGEELQCKATPRYLHMDRKEREKKMSHGHGSVQHRPLRPPTHPLPTSFDASYLEESFELLNPLFIATDKAQKHSLYQRILYPSSSSPPLRSDFPPSHRHEKQPTSLDLYSSDSNELFHDLCPLCLGDFLTGMKDTEEKYKLMIKRYDQTLNHYFMNPSPPPPLSANRSNKLIQEIFQLESNEEMLSDELRLNDQKLGDLDDHISALNHDIQQLEIDLNCLQHEDMEGQEEFQDTLSLVGNTQTELYLLSQTLSSKSLYSMSWQISHMIPTSPQDRGMRHTPGSSSSVSSSLLAQSTLSSFLATSMPSVFSIAPLSSPSIEQKILTVNRIRVTYCPISIQNLNWGEICMGWSVLGTFLQGFLHEMEWIYSQISTRHHQQLLIPVKCSYQMILLRGKIVFTKYQEEEESEGEERRGHGRQERDLYRLYCTQEEVETPSLLSSSSSHKSSTLGEEEIGSSHEYRLALLCFAISIIELTDLLNEIIQSHWNGRPGLSSPPLEYGHLLNQCPTLEYLKSLSQQRSLVHRTRQWPELEHLLKQHYPNKQSYVNLVNDVLYAVYALHSLGRFNIE